MPDRGALVNDDTAILFEVLDERSGVVSGGFKDPDAFLNSSPSISWVVRGVNAGKESNVDAERL